MQHSPRALLVRTSFAALACAPFAQAQSVAPPTAGTTEWRFTGATGANLDKIGGPGLLAYADGATGTTATLDMFTTTQAAGIPDIGGVDTPILFFDYHNPNTLGYTLRSLTGAPNDSVWRFSLVFDIYVDAINNDGWLALWQGNGTNSNDAELFMRPSLNAFYQVGSGTVAAGSWTGGQWHRVVNVVDYPDANDNPGSQDVGEIWVDGVQVFTGVAPDWWWDGSQNPCWILADNNNETSWGWMANLAFSDSLLSQADIVLLGAPDAAGIFDYSMSIGTNYCAPAVVNSSGLPAVMGATGSAVVADDDLQLTASQLPPNQFAYFLAAQAQGFSPNAGGSQGHLCLALPIGRFSNQIVNAGAGGAVAITVDLSAIPLTPPQAVLPGETWNFQCWYRDVNPGATSNFTDGLFITFQ